MSGRDYPDWGGYQTSQSLYPLKDLGELAARLDSPLKYHRSGAVAFMETFEYGVGRWLSIAVPAGIAPVVTQEFFNSKGFSAKLNGGAVAGGASVMSTIQIIPPSARIGLSYRCSFASNGLRLYSRLGRSAWISSYGVDLRYTISTGMWAVRNPAGVFVDVAQMTISVIDALLFHAVKMVVDIDANTLETLYIDNHVYSNLNLPMYNWGAGTTEGLGIGFISENVTGVTAITYIDDVILTYNEP